MLFMHRNCRRRPRAGATVVETALTLPLFILMGVGILEFGRGFMVQQMVTNAAREGARNAILAGANETDVTSKVKDYLATGSINPAVVHVSITPSTLQGVKSGTQVKVRVRVQYTDVTWMPAPWFLGRTQLSSETVMRRE